MISQGRAGKHLVDSHGNSREREFPSLSVLWIILSADNIWIAHGLNGSFGSVKIILCLNVHALICTFWFSLVLFCVFLHFL